MSDYAELLSMLRKAIADPKQLPALIPKYQHLVWHSSVSYPCQVAEDAARDLAYDLEYFVADPNLRAKDPSLFGCERAIREMRETLLKLEVKG